MLYYTILYFTTLYYTVLYYDIRYYDIIYWTPTWKTAGFLLGRLAVLHPFPQIRIQKLSLV